MASFCKKCGKALENDRTMCDECRDKQEFDLLESIAADQRASKNYLCSIKQMLMFFCNFNDCINCYRSCSCVKPHIKNSLICDRQ